MSFQFYSNLISQASRRVAVGTFITGLGLIGFGILILLLPEFFAILSAFVFFIAGIGTCVTAFKIFAAQRRIDCLTAFDHRRHRQRNSGKERSPADASRRRDVLTNIKYRRVIHRRAR